MISKRELKLEKSLADIAENPDVKGHSLLFGIIIDATEPIKYNNSDNFAVSLKVIDPSFNYKE